MMTPYQTRRLTTYIKRLSDKGLEELFKIALFETVDRVKKHRYLSIRPNINNGKDCGPTQKV